MIQHSLYFFGVSYIKKSRKAVAKINKIAKKHNACFVEANLPEGFKSWFECNNNCFSRRTELLVLSEIKDSE